MHFSSFLKLNPSSSNYNLEYLSLYDICFHSTSFLFITLPLYIYSFTYTGFTLAAFIAGVCYMTCIQECMIKVAFTMMFHLISLDKTMKYCPDHYVLGMQALKQCYQQFHHQQKQQQQLQQHQQQQNQNCKPLSYANSCVYNKKSQHARSYEMYAR